MQRYGHWKTTRHVCNTKNLIWDKPSGTIATVALRKTAEMGADKFPEAAPVIKENTYMDDIIESVPTKEKATKLA